MQEGQEDDISFREVETFFILGMNFAGFTRKTTKKSLDFSLPESFHFLFVGNRLSSFSCTIEDLESRDLVSADLVILKHGSKHTFPGTELLREEN